jgi:hypothetical protein
MIGRSFELGKPSPFRNSYVNLGGTAALRICAKIASRFLTDPI